MSLYNIELIKVKNLQCNYKLYNYNKNITYSYDLYLYHTL